MNKSGEDESDENINMKSSICTNFISIIKRVIQKTQQTFDRWLSSNSRINELSGIISNDS